VTGPSVLDVFNTLLRHLHTSVSCQSSARRLSAVKSCVSEDADALEADTSSVWRVTDAIAVEQQFQNAVVGAIGTNVSQLTVLCQWVDRITRSKHLRCGFGGNCWRSAV